MSPFVTSNSAKVTVRQGTEIGTGATKKVMPDFIKILDPKDDDNNIQPGVISTSNDQGETAQ